MGGGPGSLRELPGGRGTAQVSFMGTGGFNQAVNLSCGGLPPGAECSFNPASLTPSKTGSTVGVAATIPPPLAPGALPPPPPSASPPPHHISSFHRHLAPPPPSLYPPALSPPS